MVKEFLLLSLLSWHASCLVEGLASAVEERARLARGRLSEAFSSPSGKLTLSPEIIVPEPKDPTGILLLSDAIASLSRNIRSCKANAAFVDGSISSLKTFANEQEAARGSFPGPVPAVYCAAHVVAPDQIEEAADAGAEGIVVRVCDGKEISGVDDLRGEDSTWVELCKAALDHGLQPIPELTVNEETVVTWNEDGDDVVNLVENMISVAGVEPVSVLLTINAANSHGGDDKEAENVDDPPQVALPSIPKAFGKKVALIGSLRSTARDGQLNAESARFKEAGFAGAVLRGECIPGYRRGAAQVNLDYVGRFWNACINDLKSTRSKAFSFRSKNNMEKNVATQWANLQSDVMDSGALGDPNDSYSVLDESKGEYKGFA